MKDRMTAKEFIDFLLKELQENKIMEYQYGELDPAAAEKELRNVVRELESFTTSLGVVTEQPNKGRDGVRADGQDYGTIWKLNDQYFRIPIYYSSWDSSTVAFDETTEVEPAEEVTIVYKAKK